MGNGWVGALKGGAGEARAGVQTEFPSEDFAPVLILGIAPDRFPREVKRMGCCPSLGALI